MEDLKKDTSKINEQKSAAGENWGYDMYPERFSEKVKPSTKSKFSSLFPWNGTSQKDYCEQQIYECTKLPMVRLLMDALKSAGCEVNLRRHICCEKCDTTKVAGGFDPIMNQVLVCQNYSSKLGYIHGIMVHELTHMFDYCQNKLDFHNIDHLACTEIRAANFAHCSFLSSVVQGDSSFLRIANTHSACVKSRAITAVMTARNVTTEEATNAVEKVFTKCYNDLEPFGRRFRRNSKDMDKAYNERSLYGYADS